MGGRQRSGGSTILRDPMAVLGAASVLLPVLLSGYNSVLYAFEELGGRQFGSVRLLPRLAALCLCAVCLFRPLRKLYKVVSSARRRSKMLQHLPGPSYGILGILPLLRQRHDVHRMVTEWAEEYGPIFHLRVALFQIVVVVDPVIATHILHSKMLDKHRFQYHFLDPFLGGVNVLTGPTDPHWRVVRKGVSPAFSASRMKDAFHTFSQCAGQLAGILSRTTAPVNIDNLVLRSSMDVIGHIGFDKRMRTLASLDDHSSEDQADTMIRATHEVIKRIYEPYRASRVWEPSVRAGRRLLTRFRGMIGAIVAHMHARTPVPGSFAALLKAIKDPATGAPLKDDVLLAETAALFFAGVDTTSHTITWVLYALPLSACTAGYLLSQYPDKEAAVVAELEAAGLLATPEIPEPRSLTFADLSNLPYLQAVIKETLRMYPPVGIGQLRVGRSDISLAGQLTVPKGTILWVPHHTIHNSSLNWPDHAKFKPVVSCAERWLQPDTENADLAMLRLNKAWYQGLGIPDKSDTKLNGHASKAKRYFPFALGARDCLGRNLAAVSMSTTLATLLGRLSFSLADRMGGKAGVDKSEVYALVTGLANGMWMHAEPRVRKAAP